MTTNKLHLLLQSAYKEHHSTESALLKVKNDILMNMDAQKVTLLVLLDLSAAFDTVRYDFLLDRLRTAIGVSGKALEWFTSYLSGRSQQVAVNGGLPSSFPLKQGVPQGSCLGPVLFTIYTSKMFEIVEKHLPSVHCYADDTQLYVAFSPNKPRAHFSKVPKTFRAQKAIRKTLTCLFCKAGLFICCKGNKNKNNCKVSCLQTP